MTDRRSSENWRLEEGGQEDNKWLLEESEQQLSDQWSLQETPPIEPINSWQPVEYVKAPRPAGAWILPTIITVALLVTLGYAGYRVLPALLGTEPDATPTVDMAVVATDATPDPAVAPAEETPAEAGTPIEAAVSEQATEPAPTPPPPTPTVPSNLVSQDFATVDSAFGVNARFAPNTDAAIIRILENGERLFVFGQQGEWVELFVADTPLTEGQAFSGTVGFAASEFFTIESQQITQQLRDEVLAYTGKLPEPTVEPTVAAVAPPAASTPVTDTVTTPVTDTDTAAPSAPILTVTINAINGVNVRQTSVTEEGNIIRLLENGTVLPASGRTADNEWIQVILPDTLVGWIATEFLVPSADVTTLPVVGEDLPPAAGAPVTATGVLTSGVEPPPPAPYTNIIPGDNAPAIIITVVGGVNARSAPALDADVVAVVPQGAVLPATGRSADTQWVQVQLPTGVEAWIFRDTVTATPSVGALPAVDAVLPTPNAEAPAEPLILIPTQTPASAATAEPAPTVAPTATTAPEATTVTAEVIPFLLQLYSTPDNTSDDVARAQRGTDFVVIGKNADGSWLQVTTAEGLTGWVVGGNVRVTGDVDDVPVVATP
jgi:uncharacterized protein YraI